MMVKPSTISGFSQIGHWLQVTGQARVLSSVPQMSKNSESQGKTPKSKKLESSVHGTVRGSQGKGRESANRGSDQGRLVLSKWWNQTRQGRLLADASTSKGDTHLRRLQGFRRGRGGSRRGRAQLHCWERAAPLCCDPARERTERERPPALGLECRLSRM